MTQKLYYNDPYVREFKTKLIAQEKSENGRWFAILEETAFYPEGGGQPSDTGMLNDNFVVDVQETEGIIRHYMDRQLDSDYEINGRIDWNRRFDHMQQHCGQHILSAAFFEEAGYETVSFHLGQDICSIDLNSKELSKEECMSAEAAANQKILENIPVYTKWISKDELHKYPLRKTPSVEKDIRLVIIPEYDYNGCGGTHPESTGQVGMIKVLNWEKQREHMRVTFVCGQRVSTQLHKKNEVLKELTGVLNSPPSQMVQAIRTLIKNGNRNEKLLEEARQKNLDYEAESLILAYYDISGIKVAAHVFSKRSMADLQSLARRMLQENDVVVLLVSENEDKLQFVFGSGSACGKDMKKLIEYAVNLTGGKGGGRPSLAQGGGHAVLSGEELMELLLENIKSGQ
ncbi:DHHA1 domain-containing protein [Bacillus sp. P14.5]|uniref:alanyl-tRNA editing protein n=1 Tax=Bacillus sp. P14.5 TaxID=1983400 RepID=UPI000DEA8878|nr:DHHA1 domain-containing protein [Bacillus sp. P14.5]